MKTLAPSYSISGNAVTINNVYVPLSQILLVSNATTGQVLYSIGGPAPLSYTQDGVAITSTITLATAPSSGDSLTIYYDDGIPSNAVNVLNFPGTQAVSGTVTLGAGSATIPVSLNGGRGTNATLPVFDSIVGGTVTLAAGSASIGTVGISSPIGASAKAASVPVTIATDDPSQVIGTPLTYTNTGAISSGTVVLGPYDVSAFVEGSIQITSIGTGGGSFKVSVSNDNTNWQDIYTQQFTAVGSNAIGSLGLQKFSLFNAKYARVYCSSAFSGGTNTITLVFSPKASGLQLVGLGGGTGTTIGAINNQAVQFSKINISTQTITRSANTTAYSANTIIANGATVNAGSFVVGSTYFIVSAGTTSFTAIGASSNTVGTIFTATGVGSGTGTASLLTTFTTALPVSGADGYIVAVRASTNSNTFSTALRLHLYKSLPTLLVADNGGFAIFNADFAARVGYVDLSGWTSGSTSGTGTTSDSSVCFGSFPGSGSSLPLELASGSTTLYGILETRAAIATPGNGQIFNFSLKTQLA
jgi:hypothetical protein